MPRRPQNVHKAWHAHVYFDAATQDAAQALVTQAGQLFKVQVGRMHPELVGPHPMGSVQIAFAAHEFDTLIPWLDTHRGAMDVLVHGLSGNDLKDHTDHAYWLGDEHTLDLSMFSREG